MVGVEPTPKKDTSLSRTRLPIPPHELGAYRTLTVYGAQFIGLTTLYKNDYFFRSPLLNSQFDFCFVY